MLYTIENDVLRVQIASKGAELQSVLWKNDQTEFLWQGDPTYWSDRALNLFPNCGLLWKDQYTYQNKTYHMGIHGFVWTSELTMIHQEQCRIDFRLQANENTLAMYPFRFSYIVTYALMDNTIIYRIRVVNEDDVPMRFAMGIHPGFNVPLGGDGIFEDYMLTFDSPAPVETLVMTPDCYRTGRAEPLKLVDGVSLPLHHDLFDNDALILQHGCRAITLHSPNSQRSVRLDFPQMPYLGIWHEVKLDCPYICIEPWIGVPARYGAVEDWDSKDALTTLDAGKTYTNTAYLTING